MLLEKNDDNSGIEKQMLKSQKVLGRAPLPWVPQSLHSREAAGDGGTSEMGSDLVPLYLNHCASTYLNT